MRKSQKLLLGVNVIFILFVFIINYFYQTAGGFIFKLVASGGFMLLGLINSAFALKTNAENKKFYIGLFAGLLFCFLGDAFIDFNFIGGAVIFAVGHIFFTLTFCLIQKLKPLDFIISCVFLCIATVFLLSPVLNFNPLSLRTVCLFYAFIISIMAGKACGNFFRKRNLFNGTIFIATILFFFSDTMLVLSGFSEMKVWPIHACLSTYYPALCLLAFSAFIKLCKK